MKFEDIRIATKTGGGQEMTLAHMFQGMKETIREFAGAGQSGDFVTKDDVLAIISDVSQVLHQKVEETEAAFELRMSQMDAANDALAQRVAALEAGANGA